MDFPEKQDESRKYAEAALSLMQRHGVAPTPKNFAIWYAYQSAEYPELRRALDLLISSKEVFDEKRNSEIFGQFFALGRELAAIRQTGEKIERSMDQFRAILERMGGDASTYGEKLENFSGKAAKVGGGDDLRGLIGDILSETRKMQERSRTLESEVQRSSVEIVELRRNLDTVRRESLTDPLTGIGNRKAFDGALRNAAANAMETGESLCLLMVDIDFFKKFNDLYGHQVGDQVLRLVAHVLDSSIKKQDTAARFGGEEFSLILPQTALFGAASLAEKVRESVAARKLTNKATGERYGKITMSIGIALYQPGETLEGLVERADKCLYEAKNRGRNLVITEAML